MKRKQRKGKGDNTMKPRDEKQFDELMKDMGKKKDGESMAGDMWFPLFAAMLSMNNQPNIELEKKVAYLNGKVDTLETIVARR